MSMLQVLVEDIRKYNTCLIGFSERYYLNLKKIALNFLKEKLNFQSQS